MKNHATLSLICLFFISIFLFFSFNSSTITQESFIDDNNLSDTLLFNKDSTYVVDRIIDLKGHRVVLPKNCSLVFRNGRLKNGTLYGNQTVIVGNKNIFENIAIKGTWLIPEISTDLFIDFNKDNDLLNVFALANPVIENQIFINKGIYWVKATKDSPHIISIPNNTRVKIEGSIRLRPNNLDKYSIININGGSNIKLYGNGEIKGDKKKHIGNKGEWGMCLRLTNSREITISGLNFLFAWGDCIYIGKGCKNININNCYLKGSRRQGISITGGDSVIISDCIAKNIGGVPPGYAVDIEPNSGDTVSNVIISGIQVYNCTGGFALYTKKNDLTRRAANVKVNDCKINTTKEFALSIKGGDSISIIRCVINRHKGDVAVITERNHDFVFQENKVRTKNVVFNDTTFVKQANNKIIRGKLLPQPKHN